MKYDGTNLSAVLEEHKAWLDNITGATRANLRRADLCEANLCGANLRRADLWGADLCGADLCEANLRRADLCEANLCGANLRRANLCGADLCGANLCGADLCEANLCGANLCGADLCRADLCEADLCEANLRRADLCGANLCGANLRRADLCEANLCGANLRRADLWGAKNVPFIPMVCPDTGAFIGWKRIECYIVKLSIPAEAKRLSATTRKCRCEFADVLEIQNIDGSNSDIISVVNTNYVKCTYAVGQRVYPDSWDDDRWNECSHGIHFFMNRQEAVEY